MPSFEGTTLRATFPVPLVLVCEHKNLSAPHTGPHLTTTLCGQSLLRVRRDPEKGQRPWWEVRATAAVALSRGFCLSHGHTTQGISKEWAEVPGASPGIRVIR